MCSIVSPSVTWRESLLYAKWNWHPAEQTKNGDSLCALHNNVPIRKFSTTEGRLNQLQVWMFFFKFQVKFIQYQQTIDTTTELIFEEISSIQLFGGGGVVKILAVFNFPQLQKIAVKNSSEYNHHWWSNFPFFKSQSFG